MIRKLMFFAALFTLAPFSVYAKNLYVNNSGTTVCSDSTPYANNSPSSPWCTLGRAMWGSTNRAAPVPAQAATAGDTVLVTAGTYTAPDTGNRFLVAFNPINSGTSESERIIIQAVGTVNLRTTGTSGGPVIGAIGKSYITWDGFTVDERTYPVLNSGETAMATFSSNYGTIKNCTLIGTTTSVVDPNHAAIFFSGATNGYAYNNDISGTEGTGENVSAIYTYGTSNMVFEHNNIHNCRGGFFIKGSGNNLVTIRYNKIYNLTGNSAIRIASATLGNTNILVYQNLIYNSPNSTGITSYLGNGLGCRVVNNTIYNTAYGFSFRGGSDRILWYNNIIHTATIASVNTTTYPEPTPAMHDWQHNLYYNTTNQYAWDGGSFHDWAYWTGTWGLDTVAPASISRSNPFFSSVTENDFRLCTAPGVPRASCSASSPALTLGVDILNLSGRGTSSIIPAGAYITGNEIIGKYTPLPFPTDYLIIQ